MEKWPRGKGPEVVPEMNEAEKDDSTVRILTYNTHVCIRASKSSERIRNLWKHVLPSRCKLDNLAMIAGIVSGFDVVGLQESDGGSLRSYFANHTGMLARLARFDHWAELVNRDLYVARHSIGFLSRHPIVDVQRYRLPSRIPGRGLLVARIDVGGLPLAVAVGHLSLGERDRIRQALAITDIVRGLGCRTVLMGDFNCGASSDVMRFIAERSGLTRAACGIPTYPSWRPVRDIDHVLVSEGIAVHNARTLQVSVSDHLPVAVDVELVRAGTSPAGRVHLAA